MEIVLPRKAREALSRLPTLSKQHCQQEVLWRKRLQRQGWRLPLRISDPVSPPLEILGAHNTSHQCADSSANCSSVQRWGQLGSGTPPCVFYPFSPTSVYDRHFLIPSQPRQLHHRALNPLLSPLIDTGHYRCRPPSDLYRNVVYRRHVATTRATSVSV